MAEVVTWIKRDGATLDYLFDWRAATNGTAQNDEGDWLAVGETIALASVTAGDDLTVTDMAEANGQVTFWLSGGTIGRRYTVVCHITTNSVPAREDERSAVVRVID